MIEEGQQFPAAVGQAVDQARGVGIREPGGDQFVKVLVQALFTALAVVRFQFELAYLESDRILEQALDAASGVGLRARVRPDALPLTGSSASNSTTLHPRVARSYNISRAPNRCVIIAQGHRTTSQILDPHPRAHQRIQGVLVTLQGGETSHGSRCWKLDGQSVKNLAKRVPNACEFVQEVLDATCDRNAGPVFSGLADLVRHSLRTLQQGQ